MMTAYKTELNLTFEQAYEIRRNIGICRFLYNRYVELNYELYKKYGNSMSSVVGTLKDMPTWFMSTEKFVDYFKLKLKAEYPWLDRCSMSLWKVTVSNAETAFKRFFQGKAAFPRFKQKYKDWIKLDYTQTNADVWKIGNTHIYIPRLKNIELKESAYLPVGAKVVKGTISYQAGHYYVSIVTKAAETDKLPKIRPDSIELMPDYSSGRGIYLDLNYFTADYSGCYSLNLAKNRNAEVLQKKICRQLNMLKRQQAQYAHLRQTDCVYIASNLTKQKEKLAKLQMRLACIYSDNICKIVAQIVAAKPQYIVLGDFMPDEKLQRQTTQNKITQWQLAEFKSKLIAKCQQLHIEVKRTNNLAAQERIYMFKNLRQYQII